MAGLNHTNTMNMNLLRDSEVWGAVVHGVAKILT